MDEILINEKITRNKTLIESHITQCQEERIRTDRAIEKIWKEIEYRERITNEKIASINGKLWFILLGIIATLSTYILDKVHFLG